MGVNEEQILIKIVNNDYHHDADDGAENGMSTNTNNLLTQYLQLNGFMNTSIKCFVRSLTSDFHTIHVLADVHSDMS